MRQAYDVIAGSAFGGVSNREFCVGIIDALTEEIGFSETHEFYVDLARCSDSAPWIENGDCINDAVSEFNDRSYTLPHYCYLDIRDNEAIIVPDIDAAQMDSDIKQNDETPDDYQGDYFLVITDHGNATLYEWREGFAVGFPSNLNGVTGGSYQELWSVV